VTGAPLRDRGGARLGRAEDLIARLGQEGYPPIAGFLVRVAGRRLCLPAEPVADVAARGVARLGQHRAVRRARSLCGRS